MSAADVEHILTTVNVIRLFDTYFLGFLTYSSLSSVKFDGALGAQAFKKPSLWAGSGAFLYFSVKLLSKMFYISSTLSALPSANCGAVTRVYQVSFYITNIFVLALFASRMLVDWRGHKRNALVWMYTSASMIIIVVLSILCIWDGKIGVKQPAPLNCAYIIDSKTLPRMGFSIPLHILSVAFMITNMVLAMKVNTEHSVIINQPRKEALKTLCLHDFPLWCLGVINSFVFMMMPVLAFRSNGLIVMGGLTIFLGIQAEASSLIFQSTFAIMTGRRNSSLPVTSSDLEHNKRHSAPSSSAYRSADTSGATDSFLRRGSTTTLNANEEAGQIKLTSTSSLPGKPDVLTEDYSPSKDTPASRLSYQ